MRRRLRRRLRRWRARQRSSILFVPVPTHGAAIVPSGLVATRRLQMVEVHQRGF